MFTAFTLTFHTAATYVLCFLRGRPSRWFLHWGDFLPPHLLGFHISSCCASLISAPLFLSVSPAYSLKPIPCLAFLFQGSQNVFSNIYVSSFVSIYFVGSQLFIYDMSQLTFFQNRIELPGNNDIHYSSSCLLPSLFILLHLLQLYPFLSLRCFVIYSWQLLVHSLGSHLTSSFHRTFSFFSHQHILHHSWQKFSLLCQTYIRLTTILSLASTFRSYCFGFPYFSCFSVFSHSYSITANKIWLVVFTYL